MVSNLPPNDPEKFIKPLNASSKTELELSNEDWDSTSLGSVESDDDLSSSQEWTSEGFSSSFEKKGRRSSRKINAVAKEIVGPGLASFVDKNALTLELLEGLEKIMKSIPKELIVKSVEIDSLGVKSHSQRQHIKSTVGKLIRKMRHRARRTANEFSQASDLQHEISEVSNLTPEGIPGLPQTGAAIVMLSSLWVIKEGCSCLQKAREAEKRDDHKAAKKLRNQGLGMISSGGLQFTAGSSLMTAAGISLAEAGAILGSIAAGFTVAGEAILGILSAVHIILYSHGLTQEIMKGYRIHQAKKTLEEGVTEETKDHLQDFLVHEKHKVIQESAYNSLGIISHGTALGSSVASIILLFTGPATYGVAPIVSGVFAASVVITAYGARASGRKIAKFLEKHRIKADLKNINPETLRSHTLKMIWIIQTIKAEMHYGPEEPRPVTEIVCKKVLRVDPNTYVSVYTHVIKNVLKKAIKDDPPLEDRIKTSDTHDFYSLTPFLPKI